MEQPDGHNATFTPAEWRRYLLGDHAILRYAWHNFDEIAPGVYRSNQPTHGRLRAYRDIGITSVLCLRGSGDAIHHRMERASCTALGLRLVNIRANARKPPLKADLLSLLDHFRTLPRPFLMHCKSGADRAGLASALYLLAEEEAELETARTMMSWRYLHLRGTATGVLDHVLDHFGDRQALGAIGIRDWIEAEYDAADIAESWARHREAGRRA